MDPVGVFIFPNSQTENQRENEIFTLGIFYNAMNCVQLAKFIGHGLEGSIHKEYFAVT